jgi:Flp pilus assembly protein TadG
MMARARLRQGRRRDDRTGAAVVELALILPLILFVVLGSLELCQRLMLRQSACVAAYETARLAARRTSTRERAMERGTQILVGRRIVGGSLEITPENLGELQSGEELSVTVSVPIAGNTPITYALPVPGPIVVNATMLRE